MNNRTYIVGTIEYLVVELTEVTSTYVYSEWTGKLAVCDAGTAFDADKATWYDAVLEDDADGHHFAKALAGSTGLDPAAGTYKVFVKLTKTSNGTEVPVIPAAGLVTFTAG